MKKIYTVIGVLALGALAGCSPEQPEPAASDQSETVRTVNVEVSEVKPQLFESYLRMVGTVEATNDVQISSEVAGRIEEYFVENGDVVQKGQVLMKIDDAQLLREKQRLEAITAQSKENYERLKRLYEQESVGSEIQYLNAKYTYEQNLAALEAVNVSLDKTTVQAPFNATVENILVEEGEMASPGTALVRLIGADQMKVVAGVPARLSQVIQQGDSAQVWFDFELADTLRIPITFVGQSINPQDRTFRIEMQLPLNGKSYKTDMIVNVKVKTEHIENAVVISEEYVYQIEDEFVVYTTGKNNEGQNVAQVRRVRLGPSFNNQVVVTQGLEPGDQVVTVGSSFLRDGIRITVVENKQNVFAQQISED
jgi:RND family efflux transporter MFP subunit